jgi:hypothetical protein
MQYATRRAPIGQLVVELSKAADVKPAIANQCNLLTMIAFQMAVMAVVSLMQSIAFVAR